MTPDGAFQISGSGYTTVTNTQSVQHGIAIDFSQLQVPDDKEEEMALNVPPAVGYTPASAAKRLRVILKQMMQHPSATDGTVNNYKAAIRTQMDSVQLRLNTIRGTTRSDSVRFQVDKAQAGLEVAKTHLKNLPANTPPNNAAVKEAYALVQVLPTIDNPPSGKAENTIRAITAMIKVYWGVDSEHTPEKLPQIMEELLLQVQGAQKMESTNGNQGEGQAAAVAAEAGYEEDDDDYEL